MNAPSDKVKSLGSYGDFDVCPKKIHPPTPEIEGGENSPVPHFLAFFFSFLGFIDPSGQIKNIFIFFKYHILFVNTLVN